MATKTIWTPNITWHCSRTCSYAVCPPKLNFPTIQFPLSCVATCNGQCWHVFGLHAVPFLTNRDGCRQLHPNSPEGLRLYLLSIRHFWKSGRTSLWQKCVTNSVHCRIWAATNAWMGGIIEVGKFHRLPLLKPWHLLPKWRWLTLSLL